MKRTLAITAAATLLAISLTACGAEDGVPDSSDIAGGTTATDTMRTDQMPGTGTTDGATANTRTGTADDPTVNTASDPADGVREPAGGGLGTVAGAAHYGMNGKDESVYGVGGPNSSVYTATNNGGVTRDVTSYRTYAETAVAAAEGDRYARMLVNAHVHDHDGFLLDGENTSYDTF